MNTSSFQTQLPFAPIPFQYSGKLTLVYESLLFNQTDQNWNICQIDVIDQKEPSRLILHWESKEISENSRYLESTYRPSQAKTLEAGLVSLAYYWLTFENEDAVPAVLSHQIILDDGNGRQEKVTLDVPVQTAKPLLIQPPLRGKRWMAAEASSNLTGHRRTLIPIDGQPYIAQRYAVDWIQFNEEGKVACGPIEKNESWFCYGADILAVADGVVTQVQDGVIENVALAEERAIEITLQSAPGNYIIIDLGNDQFAFYAHMIPGSITVKEGDRVHYGQVIGKLGNSGNSDAPHLHLHISNRNSPLGSQGLPFHFPSYEWIGNTGDTDELFKLIEAGKSWTGEQPAQIRRNEYMACNDMINFLGD